MNREIAELREVITKLVPMLTGKGLKVTQRGSMAYVEACPRTNKPLRVNIPSIPDNASPDFIAAVAGFIDHEVAHVLFTDWAIYGGDGKKLNKFSPEGRALMNMHNIIEDTMIERLIVGHFPGSRKNLAQLHEHFLAKITGPAVVNAKSDEEKFAYLIVPMMRALSGQDIFQEWMDKNGHWQHPMVENLHLAMSNESLEMIKRASTTKDTLVVAQEVHDILFMMKKREEEEQRKQEEQKQQQQSSSKGQSQDKPEKEAGAGDGTGERKHTQKPEEEEGEEEEGEEEAEGKSSGSAAGKSEEKPEEEKEAEGAGGGAGEEEPETEKDGDDEAEEAEGGASQDKGDDEGEEKKEEKTGESSGEGDDQSDDEATAPESGAGDDDGEEEDGGEAASGGSDDEEDESDEDGEQSGAGGDDDDGEDEGEGLSSGVGEEEEEHQGHAGNEHGGTNEESNPGEPMDSNSAGGEAGKSMFDLDPDSFQPLDLSSAIAAEIERMASEAIADAEYAVFTKDEDQIQTFVVPDKGMKDEWVPEIDNRVQGLIGPMQKEIERMMAAQTFSVRTPGHRSGRLHAPSLYRVLQGDARVFQRKEEHRAKDTAVMLLVDNSGSMHGARLATAMMSAYALGQTLERVNIPCEIIGFTTGSLSYQAVQQMNAERAKGLTFHRASTVVMPVYKDFSERMTPAVKRRIAYQVNMQVGLNTNTDGESLEYAALRLIPRREKRKVMLVLSDGQPVGHNAPWHLRHTVQQITKRGIETVGIGINSNAVQSFYPRSLVLHKVEDLPGAVMGELRRILSN